MKRILSLTLAVILTAAVFTSCAASRDAVSANVRLTSSDAESAAVWLTDRLGDKLSGRLVIGTVADGYGVDLSGLQSDGYIIRSLGDETAVFAKTEDGLDRAVRAYAKSVESGAFAPFDLTYHEGYRVKSLTIAGTDIAEYAVIVPDDADECTINSADTLIRYIERTCGARMVRYFENDFVAPDGIEPHFIYFRSGFESLGDEGFSISVDEKGDLHIDGGIWRGTLFAVYDLLEENVGWRFPGAAFIPKDRREYLYESDHIDLTADVNRTEIPSVPIRGGTGVLQNKDTYGTMGKAALGGYGFPYRSCHGLQNNHDLIFSGDYQGLYQGWDKTGKQPCFTSEDILEAIDAYAENYVQSRLDAGQTIGKEIVDIDVAQWDSAPGDFCRCKSCMQVLKEEGSDSGAVVRMANRVASLLDDHGWGDVTVSILAYYGTDILPLKARPAHNVLVSYCFFAGVGYEQCSNHCISGADCDPSARINNAVPAERFEKWVEVMDPKNIQVWYYVLNWRKITYNSPIYTILLDDMKYLAEKGVGHVYLCYSAPADGVVNVELSKYLCGKYLWDASITEEEADALIRDWFRVVYADAGDYLYQCAMLQEYAGDIAGCWGVIPAENVHMDFKYMARHGDEVWNYYEKAIAAAGSAEEQRIIENYMAGVLYTVVCGGYGDMYVNGDAEAREKLCKWYDEVFRLFRDHRLPIVANVYSVGDTARFLSGEADHSVDPVTWMDAARAG